ncbi:uroporphyrinogen-III synthase [Staphylococcus gallinarum]|uniref:uroporphyrinogen-III synthase n=1 Tax=Staphylococcus gallinarum TaxID=1293 RepID=UPI001E61D31F|nr:uroporphyrinogen-III synthase [Staphylococcus gallinarum]MCD8827983.1 uroporphyrinogen-III synthase [Staphylococcus gallinarum]MEB6055230.1 uroporphyrinogen-III synthase [Staphylococcus gallinarum]
MRPVIVMTQTSKFKREDVCILHKPLIDVAPLSFDTELLEVNYDWLIFSSKKAVEYFLPYFTQTHVNHVAVIGKKTAEYCQSKGIQVDYCPKDYSQEGFIQDFQGEKHSKILIPSSQAARPYLQYALEDQAFSVQKIDLYQPIPHTENINNVIQLLSNNAVDAITFASSSAVEFFFNQAGDIDFNHYYVIGDQTLATINKFDIQATKANIQTLDSLVNKILESWKDNAI